MLRFAAALGTLAIAAAVVADSTPPAGRHSGHDFMSREIRAMQDDDSANPGMLAVLEGSRLWARKTGAADRACADCHGDASTACAAWPRATQRLTRSGAGW